MNAPDLFVSAFNALCGRAFDGATAKGWWDDRNLLVKVADQHSVELGKFARVAIAGMSIALMHSELSEALESIRHGNPPDDKVPEFSGEEAEYADTIIRIMDTAAANGLKVGEAIVAKMRMNMTRAHKHGGKLC